MTAVYNCWHYFYMTTFDITECVLHDNFWYYRMCFMLLLYNFWHYRVCFTWPLHYFWHYKMCFTWQLYNFWHYRVYFTWPLHNFWYYRVCSTWQLYRTERHEQAVDRWPLLALSSGCHRNQCHRQGLLYQHGMMHTVNKHNFTNVKFRKFSKFC